MPKSSRQDSGSPNREATWIKRKWRGLGRGLRWVLAKLVGSGLRASFSALFSAMVALVCWLWTIYSPLFWPPEPKVFPDYTHGIIEISSSGIRAVAIRYDSDTKAEAKGAQFKRFTKNQSASLQYNAGAGSFNAKSISDVVKSAEELMVMVEREQRSKMKKVDSAEELARSNADWVKNLSIKWQVVLTSRVRSKDKASEEAMKDVKRQLAGKLVCEVSEVTTKEEGEYLYKGIVPEQEWESESTVAVEIGWRSINACFFLPANGINGPAKYHFTHDDIPGTETIVTFDKKLVLNTENDRRKFAKQVQEAAQLNIAQPLQAITNAQPFFANSEKVYIAGQAVLAMCRIARPDLSPDLPVVLDFKKDLPLFQERLIQEGHHFAARPGAALNVEQKALYEAELEEVRKQFNTQQLITASEVLAAIDSELEFHKPNRKVFFQNSRFEWVVEYLLRRLKAKKDGVAALPNNQGAAVALGSLFVFLCNEERSRSLTSWSDATINRLRLNERRPFQAFAPLGSDELSFACEQSIANRSGSFFTPPVFVARISSTCG